MSISCAITSITLWRIPSIERDRDLGSVGRSEPTTPSCFWPQQFRVGVRPTRAIDPTPFAEIWGRVGLFAVGLLLTDQRSHLLCGTATCVDEVELRQIQFPHLCRWVCRLGQSCCGCSSQCTINSVGDVVVKEGAYFPGG